MNFSSIERSLLFLEEVYISVKRETKIETGKQREREREIVLIVNISN